MGKATVHLDQNDCLSTSKQQETKSIKLLSESPAKPKLSFEDQLTFVPTLNPTSLKLAMNNRTSIVQRRKKEKHQKINSCFLFQPKVSDGSNKIAAKLKIGFWERQNIHMQRQKQMIEQGPSTVHPNLRHSPVQTKDIEGVTRDVKSSDNLKQIMIKEKIKEEGRKKQKMSKSFDSAELYRSKRTKSNMAPSLKEPSATKPSEVAQCKERHQELSNNTFCPTAPPRESERKHQNTIVKNNVFPDLKSSGKDQSKLKENSQRLSDEMLAKRRVRSFTFPQRTEELDAKHQHMLNMKKISTEAVKNKKVFVCNGPYATLRAALRRRGWIEKKFKQDEMLKLDNKIEESQTSENIQENSFLCDGQYGIMSRMVRNSKPSFIWTLRNDEIRHQYLDKDQIVNHYSSAGSFTTKSGLCSSLKNVHHFVETDSLAFFPRCYRLCCLEEQEGFIQDFRITAITSVLKIVILNKEMWREMETNKDEEEKNSLSGESEKRKNTKKVKFLPSSVMLLVMKECHKFLDLKQHLRIEEDYVQDDQDMDEINWRRIVKHYYEIAHQGAVVTDAWLHAEECENVVKQMEKYCPQITIDGCQNLWILKPGAKSRGRGIEIKNRLDEILNVVGNISNKENKWVIQKYIERPFLVYRTKFDIRQWFLVTDWNPLMLWFYQDSYIRFCGQEFTLDNLDAQFHLSNNSIQKHYEVGERSEYLPDFNMWTSEEFKMHLLKRGYESAWEEVIYPGMKNAIIAVLQSCQDSLEYRKNAFELYGADFMLSEDLQPWLIEINSSPALGASTPVTEILCRNVIEDTLKVVLDRRENKLCDTGRFELAFKRPYVVIPSYMGCTIAVEGTSLKNVNRTRIKPMETRVKPDDSAMSITATKEGNLVKKSLAEPKKNDVKTQRGTSKSTFSSKDLGSLVDVQPLLNAENAKEKQFSQTSGEMKCFSPSKLNIVIQELKSEADQVNMKYHNVTVAELFQTKTGEDKNIGIEMLNPVKLHSRCCSHCSETDEVSMDLPVHKIESYDIKKLKTPFLMQDIKGRMEKKKPCGKNTKQYGILAARDITGIKIKDNYAPVIVNRYDKSRVQDIYVKAGCNIQVKDAG
ncbi:tubulin tyrosine ligase 3-like isoform X2 [Hydractinia symbiolongicarpus]|uniref:tubulin tyrosine ligase 3-like isoform X2 n=1 Tax=Hydractinia symbiolongicarpus TaxID=13093 RepID=UPI00254DAC74|nr:tubulin tyrosine ligase 3-like isoform X2 [Hydractinia symbiolongicarpus]